MPRSYAGAGAPSNVGTVPARPYTIVSCAVSVDGYLDDASPERLILSGPEDLDEVDELRAAGRRDPGRRRHDPRRQPAGC